MYEGGTLGPSPFNVVEVTCEIVVNGQKVAVWQTVDRDVWNDLGLRRYATETVQMALLLEVIKRFPPPVTVR